jgi:hypothetical protein
LDIEANLTAYLGARTPTDRYASFDYCFNYFQEFRERDRMPALVEAAALEYSSLQLGFYLASWGMLRGSTVLLKRSVKHLAPVIDVISRSPVEVWNIDANDYSSENCERIIDTARKLRAAIPEGASDTLVTKIMLGVFGSVPAFDTNFKKGSGFSTFGQGSLKRIGAFYKANADVIDRLRVTTLDFDTGAPTSRRYSRAKVIDMIFYVEGS